MDEDQSAGEALSPVHLAKACKAFMPPRAQCDMERLGIIQASSADLLRVVAQ